MTPDTKPQHIKWPNPAFFDGVITRPVSEEHVHIVLSVLINEVSTRAFPPMIALKSPIVLEHVQTLAEVDGLEGKVLRARCVRYQVKSVMCPICHADPSDAPCKFCSGLRRVWVKHGELQEI